MTIFVGNREIKRIYVGGQGYIKKAYYGRKLVYEIADLFESGTNGTYTVFIDTPGIYEISICGAGGGGGGSATSHDWLGANGGSGAAFRGNVLLDRITLTITIGKGGNGGNASGADAKRGSAGGLSRITDENNNVLITAGAGAGGHGTGNNYGGGGQGGTLTMGTAEVISYEIQSNGASSSTVSILGNGYGAGGARRSHASGTAGTNGYVRIKYIGPEPKSYTFTINPTPNDSTVQLTVNGTTYTQNSITVFEGTTVNWSVSKSGYTTQTGSDVVTEDITKNVVLEELSVPLYYCYTSNLGSTTYYFYYVSELVSVGQAEKVYRRSDGTTRATNSSQLSYSGVVEVVDSISGNTVVVYQQGASGLKYSNTRASQYDLYT